MTPWMKEAGISDMLILLMVILRIVKVRRSLNIGKNTIKQCFEIKEYC